MFVFSTFLAFMVGAFIWPFGSNLTSASPEHSDIVFELISTFAFCFHKYEINVSGWGDVQWVRCGHTNDGRKHALAMTVGCATRLDPNPFHCKLTGHSQWHNLCIK